MVIEEMDVGLYVLDREGLVVAVALVDAVQPAPHAVAVGLGGAAAQCHQQGEYNNQLFHFPCKGKKNISIFQIIPQKDRHTPFLIYRVGHRCYFMRII
jgi:hypothetical protein